MILNDKIVVDYMIRRDFLDGRCVFMLLAMRGMSGWWGVQNTYRISFFNIIRCCDHPPTQTFYLALNTQHP